ncbi:hypothetical protein Mal15_34440 [Stieleria maiorica]|uniref:Uncharacterized protein n=1 Tax=Stieleria maiorica TaxID=2795974 RepID=A0A5B9MHB5_9BACT|nr:hypothetical protein [Stieleria maiorica]QEF99380.1 hypothetical protein Mal15_34440 [Stieleria maiorica]
MSRLMVCLLAAVVAAAAGGSEPFLPLRPEGNAELRGRVSIEGDEFALQLVDRDGDGDYLGNADRLSIDLDRDGRFHPLRERYASGRPLRLREVDAADRYEIRLLENPWRIRLIPIRGMGAIRVRLDQLQPNAVISKLNATFVSKSGIHREIQSVDEAVVIPAGSYRLQSVFIEANDGRHWSIEFKNFNAKLAYSINVAKDQTTSCALLGALHLDAQIAARDYLGGKLLVLPQFISETGLTLVRCEVGDLEPSDESRLAASLVNTSGSDKVIDRRSSGFACGSLCPLVFKTDGLIEPQMQIRLMFDIGPLGGVIRHQVAVKRPAYQPPANDKPFLNIEQ